MIWTVTAAAAAVLALGVLVAVQSNPAVPVAVPLQAGSALAMTPVAPTPLHSSVTISSQGRGTRIQMNFTYGVLPQNSGHDETETGDTLAMVVVGRDGSRAQRSHRNTHREHVDADGPNRCRTNRFRRPGRRAVSTQPVT